MMANNSGLQFYLDFKAGGLARSQNLELPKLNKPTNHMNIIILSGAKRRVETLPQCLDSFFKTTSGISVTIATDRRLTLPTNPLLTFHTLDYGNITDPKRKMINAYYQCLGLSNQNVLICEDDILFTDGWMRNLHEITKSLHGQKYVLSLYNKGLAGNTPYLVNPPKTHCGALGIYLPSEVREELLNYSKKFLRTPTAHDCVIQSFCQSTKYPLLICNPSLVTNNGGLNNSTWATKPPLPAKVSKPIIPTVVRS